MSLRLSSLAMKMLLMLYMGKYLGLYDLGTYGLIAAAVALSIPIFGMRLEYRISREIVGLAPHQLVIKLRDEFAFYLSNYILLIIGALLWVLLFSPEIGLIIIGFTILLCVLEGISTVACTNLIALSRPIVSNLVFFFRSSIWVIPAIALGLYDPSFRTVETIITLWAGGVFISIAVVAYIWRDLPWRAALSAPFDKSHLYSNIKKILPIWFGEMSIVAALYIDRFVVEHFLGREYVGILSFYGAFIIAISSLLASGIFAFAYPKMIAMHKDGQFKELSSLTKKITIQAAISTMALAVIIGAVIPILGDYMERPEFRQHVPVLWLMLLASWINLTTSSLKHLSYARHQDWAIWGGNFLLLALTASLNIIMVSIFGFIGVGYSAVIASLALVIWRIYCMFIYNKKHEA